ncbi:hypothetical protein [Paraclostridium bifermentans]|uniref:hypothetical protein n=1 Tax=Paraclostridium bifermentans TaxID=1490 RepID=UPI000A177B1E|nr:hypothetical protein [Paraclostridium bifermentans]OSB09112.1 hypothetical protein B2H97_12395 [Paraclostridium bifermentans]
MRWYLIVLVFISLLGASTLAYQVFKMTELDAKSRGFKHPKAWGVFALSGNNSSGLLLYLIGRKKYLSHISDVDKQIIESRKKKAGVSLIFFALSTIALFSVFVLKF